MSDRENAPDRTHTGKAERLTLKWRKRLAILLLLVGLPVYIVLAVHLVESFERPGPAIELLVYVVLGIVWALPFRTLFLGVAAKQPEDDGQRERSDRRG
jgi:hypothetical protein